MLSTDSIPFNSRREVLDFHIAALAYYRSKEEMQSPEADDVDCTAKYDALLYILQEQMDSSSDDARTLRFIRFVRGKVVNDLEFSKDACGEDDNAFPKHVALYTMLDAMEDHLITELNKVESRRGGANDPLPQYEAPRVGETSTTESDGGVNTVDSA